MRFVLLLALVASVCAYSISDAVTTTPIPDSAWIRTYDDAIPAELCDELIDMLDETEAIRGSLINYINADYRKSIQLFFPRPDVPRSQELYDQLVNVIRTNFERYKGDAPHYRNLNWAKQIEGPSILKYEPEEGEFKMHIDAWDPPSASRLVSVILYLNDVAEGGHTYFPNQGVRIAPKRGSITFFPSGMTFPHEGQQASSGPKYIVVTWLSFLSSQTVFNRGQAI